MIIFLLSLFLAVFKSLEISNKETTHFIVKIFMISLNFWIAYYYSFLYCIGYFIISFIEFRLLIQTIKNLIVNSEQLGQTIKSIEKVLNNYVWW